MKLLYPLLFLVCALIIGSSWMRIVVGASPQAEAQAFITDVRRGGLAKSVKHFGGNVCRCPHKGGWGASLIYVSGQEPNLAFMTGHPFTYGNSHMVHVPNPKEALIPWQKPEDTVVDVPLSFDPKIYSPLFLPLAMAYGQTMTEDQLNDFLKDPDKDAWKGFTLRFRPSLKPGAIAPPTEPLPRDAAEEFKDLKSTASGESASPEKDTKTEDETTEEAVKQALGADALTYFKPQDAGPVIDANGKTIEPGKIEALLPRLKSVILRLHVVRRGAVNVWTIYHFGLVDPILLLADGTEFKLNGYQRPVSNSKELNPSEALTRPRF